MPIAARLMSMRLTLTYPFDAFSKARLKPLKNRAEQPAFLPRAQPHRGQGRRQRQRVEGGDQHRDRNRDGELLVQAALNAAKERDRDEDRRQDEGDADDRSRDLLHGLERRVARRHPFLDVMLHRLHDDYRIVDDKTDGEDEAEQ